MITGQSKEPEGVYDLIKQQINELKQEGVNEEDFNRTKKMIYGGYVKEYNSVQDISRMFLSDFFKGVNSFDYLEEIQIINIDYINQILKEVFNEEKMIISIVK